MISGNNKRWSAVEAEVEPEILEDMGVGMLEDEGPGDGQKTQKSSLEQVTQYFNITEVALFSSYVCMMFLLSLEITLLSCYI